MSRATDIRHPPFHVSEHCRLTIGGKAFRLGYRTGDAYVLAPAEGTDPAETFTFDHLSRLNRAGHIHHEREHFLPPHLRTQAAPPRPDITTSDLDPEHASRVNERYAMVSALIDLQRRGEVVLTYQSINAAMLTIRVEALKYLAKLPDEARLNEVYRALKTGDQVPLPAGIPLPRHRAAKTLLQWRKKFLAGGKLALVDGIDQRGDRSSAFPPEVDALLVQTVRASYLTREQKSKVAVTADVRRAFEKENEERAAKGLSLITDVPRRDAVRAAIARLDKLEVMIARHGEDYAKKMFRAGTTGLEVSRPLERVEIDECWIDLRTILSQTRLRKIFTPEEIVAFGLDKEKIRWWIVVAIDCRTRMILALKLTPNPRASAAVECLRMIMADKGEFADQVGALTPWSQCGTPEGIVHDAGSGLTSIDFSDACADLRITDLTAIAGAASARGRIERLFQTIAKGLLCRLSGRTFSDTVKRGDYDADARACLGTEDMCRILVRWIVDIYHNTPHTGLGLLTPLEQWQSDMAAGNYPLKALPSLERQRVAFGIAGTYRLTKHGVVILGIPYNSLRLASHFAAEGAIMLQTRWDHADLGAISVRIDDVWVEVPAVHERFRGLTAQVWIAARQALREAAAARKSHTQAVIFKAIDDIEATNQKAKLQSRLVDQAWTPERLQHFQSELFANFSIAADAPTVLPVEEGVGRSIIPTAPAAFTPEDEVGEPAASTPQRASRKARSSTRPAKVAPTADAPPSSSAPSDLGNAAANTSTLWRPPR
ncbi:DDE-type integrase/transposase/recombinase [Rhodobacter sp. CZR27]|uniref:DDE-type integrase/transposase/recombinase n=1 Tax=Rhodobacter sp. CZR27 TaxID=2033869 RepID=UPI0012FD636A|nr:DDE-type integrase/transposase/recombinase [Rhodobacter sp. CZR27]